MLRQEQRAEIRVLARQGKGIRAIARELGISRTTVGRYLGDPAARGYGPRALLRIASASLSEVAAGLHRMRRRALRMDPNPTVGRTLPAPGLLTANALQADLNRG